MKIDFPFQRGLLCATFALVLAACSAAPTARPAAPTTPSVPALPTVTSIPAQPQASATPAPTDFVIVLPTPVTPTVVVPTATPGVVQSAAGPVNGVMASLNVAAEPYATLGDPNAPITIIEFADFGCEFCRVYHNLTFGALRSEYITSGKVYYIFKDLPVTSTYGDVAANAAECAGEQAAYWPMHALLFAERDPWYASREAATARASAAAAELGLDGNAFAACLSEQRFKANVDANFAEAQALRLYGTPAFLINGRLLAGARPIETWREILDDLYGEEA